jgi:transcriptional regulator with XRE-family HTH domain
MKWITQLRTAKGMSQAAVAKEVGMFTQDYNRVETGKSIPSRPKIAAIEKFYGQKFEVLMQEVKYEILEQAIATSIGKGC